MKKILTLLLAIMLITSMSACTQTTETPVTDTDSETETTTLTTDTSSEETAIEEAIVEVSEEQTFLEETLNLANNPDQEWSYSLDSNAWVLSIVSAVAYPELPDQQGVSVAVPGAYVTGIDTDGDGGADVTSATYTVAVKGSLVIDYSASITSTNGQVYTAATAPVILNTGAAGYGNSTNTLAATTYAAEGYINIACGNRGKQDIATDADGNEYYTGDAPSCLVDQKAAARYVKYNILLGNLPGSVDYFISTGGSGGGAHAIMFAATSNNEDFYDYQIAAGAVGIYQNEDGTYSSSVIIDGQSVALSDGAWGSIAYSGITSLYEADMAMAFEYFMDTTYDFNTSFQAQVAEYLSETYMTYINDQNLSVEESEVGFDLNSDGDLEDTISLSIEYDLENYPDTNGYYGTYLDLYLAEFTQNLQWYLDSLDYAEGWTWFNTDGSAMSDSQVAAMTNQDRATAFIEGRYATSSAGGMGVPGGMMGGPGGEMPEGMTGGPGGEMPEGMTGGPGADNTETNGDEMTVGTPDAGTTQSATSGSNSNNYASYEEMVAAYEADINEVYAGDQYGNNIVTLYNPLAYIDADTTENPTWTRILMGASEGDLSMFNSLNLQINWLAAGVDATIEWQWNGGHVPSEILGDTFALYVDQMYGEHVEGAVTITKSTAVAATTNGTEEAATGTDISDWVTYDENGQVSFSLADIAAYRTSGASKATPGFDVIDYGQEDYVFGNTQVDARHWNIFLLDIFQEHADMLEPLF